MQALHAPTCVAPHDAPLVLRAQVAVSVSGAPFELHAPLPQVKVVTVRVREPELVHVVA